MYHLSITRIRVLENDGCPLVDKSSASKAESPLPADLTVTETWAPHPATQPRYPWQSSVVVHPDSVLYADTRGGFIKRVSISLCSFRGRTPSRLSCIQPQQLIPHLSGPFSPSLSQTLQGEGRRSDAGGLESAKQAVRSGPPNLFLFFDPRVCSRFFCDLWRAEDFSGSFPSFVGWSRCLPRFSRQLSLRWPDRPDAPGVPGTKCSTYCAFCHSSVGFSSASEVLRSILMKIHLQKNSYLFLISLWKKRKILTRV